MRNLILMFVLLLSSAGFGQTTFTLEAAKEYALENHLAIQNAELETQKAVYKKRETIGIGLPQADITGSFNYFINLPRQKQLTAPFLVSQAPWSHLKQERSTIRLAL